MAKKTTKKRNKPHNLRKSAQLQAQLRVRGQLVFFAQGHGCYMYDTNSNRIYRPNDVTSAAIAKFTYEWSVLCSILCDDGKDHYLKSNMINAKAPYRSEALAETAKKVHMDLLAGANRQHVCGLGWVASPEGKEISDELAYELYDAFDLFGENKATFDEVGV